MDFASCYVFDTEEEEYEYISNNEFDAGMQLSDSESEADDEAGPLQSSIAETSLPQKKKKKKQKLAKHESPHHCTKASTILEDAINAKKGERQTWFRRADTNVVSVSFETLLSPGHMHAGDPVVCSTCQAILSQISKPVGEEEKVWTCEFCSKRMHVDIDDEEIPNAEDVTYLIEPALATKCADNSGQDQSLVIFCMDTSGSMCVTTEVEGKVSLHGNSQLKHLESFNTENENQYLPSQRNKDVTYISRLQAMQAAVDDQLVLIARDYPNRKIGLVTFSSEVAIIGDGQAEKVTVAGDKLSSIDELIKHGAEATVPQAIQRSQKLLRDKLYKLEEGGSTALGPALVVAVNMAAHHPGSKVILCTDGKANIGLGKMEDENDETAGEEFYSRIGDSAVSKGVSISVITIEGTDCKLVHLGKLSDKTGGQVNIVNPLKLTEEFGNILADPIIATSVESKLLVYKALYVVDETDPDLKLCHAELKPGNVKSSTTITFEFRRRAKDQGSSSSGASEIKGDEDAQQGEKAGEASPTEYPFQLQIRYTDVDGTKALRVITRSLPATKDRNTAEKHVNMDVLSVHAARTTADYALQGQYTRSRGVAFMNQRLAQRSTASAVERARSKDMCLRLRSMEHLLQQKQRDEVAQRGTTLSDCDSDDDDNEHANLVMARAGVCPIPSSKQKKSLKMKKMRQLRSSEMEDDVYKQLYDFHNIGKSKKTSAEDSSSDKE